MSTLPDLHLEYMGVFLKAAEDWFPLVPVSNWPRLRFDWAALLEREARAEQGAVAQLGERLICTQEVAGSIPTSSTSSIKHGPVAQLVRAHP